MRVDILPYCKGIYEEVIMVLELPLPETAQKVVNIVGSLPYIVLFKVVGYFEVVIPMV